MSTQPNPTFSIEQYLEIDRVAEVRSEYIGGQMYSMAGTTLNHNRIVGAAWAALLQQLRGNPCEPAATELRLFIEANSVLTYPDILVFCGPAKFRDTRRDTVTDATLIVEVLSQSTQNYDRAEKFEYYRSLPSFAEYLLIRQDRPGAELHTRQPDGSWLFREISAPSSVIELASIGCALKLDDLYTRVDFEA